MSPTLEGFWKEKRLQLWFAPEPRFGRVVQNAVQDCKTACLDQCLGQGEPSCRQDLTGAATDEQVERPNREMQQRMHKSTLCGAPAYEACLCLSFLPVGEARARGEEAAKYHSRYRCRYRRGGLGQLSLHCDPAAFCLSTRPRQTAGRAGSGSDRQVSVHAGTRQRHVSCTYAVNVEWEVATCKKQARLSQANRR